MDIPNVTRTRLNADDRFLGQGAEGLDGDVLDFWQWAFGDLRPNNLRGVFSEWLVAQLLGIPLDAGRDPWAAWDLRSEDGVTIEVKSCACRQSWHEGEALPSRICWSRLSGQTWDATTKLYSGQRTYNADLYVFCVETEMDPRRWNALDLDQWRFYLLTREQVAGLNTRSLSESRLRTLTHPMSAAEFRVEGRAAIERAIRTRRGTADSEKQLDVLG